MHERLAVYVPNPDAPPDAARQVESIAPGSGIVGRIVQEQDPDESPVLIYYEGNIYGAGNMVTFADRVYFAAGRMTTNAPTVALRLVRPDALAQVGWFYPQHQRVELVSDPPERSGGLAVVRLARWLGLYDEARHKIDADALAPELFETRAVPAHYKGQRVHVTPQDRERLARDGVRLEDA